MTIAKARLLPAGYRSHHPINSIQVLVLRYTTKINMI